MSELTAPTDAIGVETALLLLMAGALVFVAKLLADVRNRLDEIETKLPEAAPRRSAPSSTPASGPSEGVPAHIVAAITAAVHATISAPHRLVAVAAVSTERQAWSVEGRRQVFQSHRVR